MKKIIIFVLTAVIAAALCTGVSADEAEIENEEISAETGVYTIGATIGEENDGVYTIGAEKAESAAEKAVSWAVITPIIVCVVLLLAFPADFLLAIIPMKIGKKKGYSGIVCYLFGLFVFLPALFTTLLLPEKETKAEDKPEV